MFEKLKTNIWKILAGIGALFSAVFYVLFQSKKDEEREEKLEAQQKEIDELKETLKQEENYNHGVQEVIEQEQKERKENEEKINNIGTGLNGFTNVINGLR